MCFVQAIKAHFEICSSNMAKSNKNDIFSDAFSAINAGGINNEDRVSCGGHNNNGRHHVEMAIQCALLDYVGWNAVPLSE